MINIYKVSKTFSKSKKKIFNGVSYQFNKSKVYVLEGPNGSGKTTFLKMLTGLSKPNSGAINFEKEIKTSFVSSNERSFFGRLTGLENLYFFAEIDGISRNTVLEFLHNHENGFKFKEFINKMYIHLSSGQKKKMAVARGLLKEPRLLLLDEPFNFLDVDSKNYMVKLIEDFSENNLVIITSNNDDHKKLRDFTMLQIKNGKIH